MFAPCPSKIMHRMQQPPLFFLRKAPLSFGRLCYSHRACMHALTSLFIHFYFVFIFLSIYFHPSFIFISNVVNGWKVYTIDLRRAYEVQMFFYCFFLCGDWVECNIFYSLSLVFLFSVPFLAICIFLFASNHFIYYLFLL